MKPLRATVIGLAICALAAGPVLAGSGGAQRGTYRSRPDVSVIMKRSPNIGFHEHLRLYVDGRLFAVLGYGRSYEGLLPAGEHLVVMSQVPHLNDAYPVHYQRIHVVPGQPNIFTVTWIDGGSRLALERS